MKVMHLQLDGFCSSLGKVFQSNITTWCIICSPHETIFAPSFYKKRSIFRLNMFKITTGLKQDMIKI